MRTSEHALLERTADAETAGLPARHVADLARALVVMGGMATAISSRLPVTRSEAAAIRRSLPKLAARHGLLARFEDEGSCVTVTLEREP